MMIAVEVEGGIWTNGRHTRGGHWFAKDCEKYTEAAICCWSVLRYCSHHITTIAPKQLQMMWEMKSIVDADKSIESDNVPEDYAETKQPGSSKVRQPRRSVKKKIK
tara:strand:+ start:2222 stop:2539 length:318 start_codon:yes stop_codon:yes gene_type:complete